MDEKVAIQVVAKYLRKGNMARCLRDILPSAGLSVRQREEIANLVHLVVRWKRLFEYLIQIRNIQPSATTYVKLAQEQKQIQLESFPFEYRYSCSQYVASVLKDHEEWAKYLNESPPTTLCVNQNKTTIEHVLAILRQEGLPAEHSVLPTAVHTTSVSKYSAVVKEFYVHVQDEGSQLISFITASLGDSLFDFCAGNGGKSLAIAALTQNQKIVHAYEINAVKRKTLTQRCAQYTAKVTIEDDIPKRLFDVVLVDAPCSGLGAARRNPEAKYINNAGNMPQRQTSLLIQAAANVKPGGFLVYAVCTITAEETSEVIKKVIDTIGYSQVENNDLLYHQFLQKSNFGSIIQIPQGDLFFLSVLKKPLSS